uniref:Uncharacterized protein n=1 Tax=Rhizophora mucronata TaxID=61149 RepID=A0A2P2NN61_RHIMU
MHICNGLPEGFSTSNYALTHSAKCIHTQELLPSSKLISISNANH